MIDDPAKFRGITVDAKRIVDGLLEMEKPIVCRLNGAAAGLGASIALLCDVIIADDDGAVVVPITFAEQLAEAGGEHSEWEVFTREKLSGGGDLRKYYPLNDEAKAEYEVWKKTNG